MRFTLKQLRYFVTAGDCSSVTRAAQELFVSQPSISSAIIHLEEVTGLQLFLRHHAQGLSLTSAGQQFMAKAKQLLGEAESLALYADTLGDEVTGSLRIVGFPTFTPILVPGLIRHFHEVYPAVTVQCDEKSQDEVIQGLEKGQYELALTYDLQIPASIEFEPLMEFPPYAVLSEHHPLAHSESLTLKQLAQYPMVVLDWPMSREYFFSLFLSQRVEPNFAFQAKSMDMVRSLVANGFGYSLFNVPLITPRALDGSKLVQVPLSDELRPLRMGVARLAQFRLTPAATAFTEELGKAAQRLTTTLFTDSRFYRSLK